RVPAPSFRHAHRFPDRLSGAGGQATAFSRGFDRSIPFSNSKNASYCVIRVGVSRTISASSATTSRYSCLFFGASLAQNSLRRQRSKRSRLSSSDRFAHFRFPWVSLTILSKTSGSPLLSRLVDAAVVRVTYGLSGNRRFPELTFSRCFSPKASIT